MDSKQIGMIAVAVVAIAAAAFLIVRHLGSSDEATVEATWVCDSCGAKAEAELTNTSAPCPKCSDGQLVQRVFFRCKKCEKAFEGYQVNWSPLDDRAADARKSAGAKPTQVPDKELQMIRKPGGKWLWRVSKAGTAIARTLDCPSCGKMKRDQFDMVSDRDAAK